MDMNFILASIGVFLVIILILVVILLVAKNYLSPSGPVKITINGDNELEVESGSSLLTTLSQNGVYLPSACGGKGACGQCKCQEFLVEVKSFLLKRASLPVKSRNLIGV